MTLYLNGVRVTKQKGFAKFNVACKWKRKYWGWASEEGWFILTNLPDLESAILAYKKRFGIEEMFRDFKKGGYNLEETNVTGKRLVTIILLIAIAYMTAARQGLEECADAVSELIGLARNKWKDYQKGMRAMKLILSAL